MEAEPTAVPPSNWLAMESRRLKILLIEDDPDHAALVQGHLDILYGHPVAWEWVDRLDKGIERASKEEHDVILLDLRLPGTDFPETLRRLVPHAQSTPIVVLTALNDAELAMQAVREGAQDYLVKMQMSGELLLRTIRYAIERMRFRATLEQTNRQLKQEIVEREAAEEALREHQGELERLNAELEVRVAQRTADLSATNEVLAQRNRELRDFTYIASHHLQEPLRKIQTFSDLLKSDLGRGQGEHDETYLARMQDAAARMSRLISDLLAFSRIGTSGRSFRQVDLNEILKYVESSLRDPLDESEVQVEVGQLPSVEGDPTQLHQLFSNLLSNSVKFRREGSESVVRIYASDEEPGDRETVTIVIEDNGIGFEEKYMEKIFGPFQRLHGRSEYEGTGMGLAICRRIAERHGGTLTATSRVGEGSTFRLTLPRRQ